MDNKLQIFLPETTLTLGTLKEKLLNVYGLEVIKPKRLQPIGFYITVAIVGALADLAVNKYVSSRPATGSASSGLKDFYSKVSPVNAMILASVTFVAVVFIADLAYSYQKKV